MTSLRSKGSFSKFYSWLPLIILFISVFNEFDFNYLNLDYFSFNFPFILIFYFTLKGYGKFDFFLVFIAGLVNDTVVGTPLGLSSFSYIIVCVLSAYLRNITIRPDLIKDWFYFLFVITLINSINYLILFSFFSYELEIIFYVINNLFTFLLYLPLSLIFNNYLKTIND